MRCMQALNSVIPCMQSMNSLNSLYIPLHTNVVYKEVAYRGVGKWIGCCVEMPLAYQMKIITGYERYR
jgi:hypothetical protein